MTTRVTNQTKSTQSKMDKAVQAFQSGNTYRAVAREFGVDYSTLYRRINTAPSNRGRRPALSTAEETLVVKFLVQYANRGIPLTQNHLKEAIHINASRMPPQRRSALPFKHCSPGRTFLRAFRRRHADKLSFCKPLRQEAKRFMAVNSDVLNTHFVTLERLVEDHGLDAARVFNLDECGTTPGKDLTGIGTARRLLPRRGVRDIRLSSFKYLNRVTMMPVINAFGQSGPPLFVFKGTKMPYRTVLKGGIVVEETPACNLPFKSTVALRAENGAVDTANFVKWAHTFVEFTNDLRCNNRKVLLIYDGYRSHLSLQVLELFHLNDIIVYALPAHTSGKTQPLDTVLFSVFKQSLNRIINNITLSEEQRELNMFDICALLSRAYEESFTPSNIRAGFRRAGVWPVDATRILNVSRPLNSCPNAEILTVEQLAAEFEKKRVAFRDHVLGSDAVMMDNGYVDTTKGCVMTSENVLKLVREKKRQDHLRFNAETRKRREREQSEERRRYAAVQFSQRVRDDRMRRLAFLAGKPVGDFVLGMRSFAERRAVARLRTQARDFGRSNRSS